MTDAEKIEAAAVEYFKKVNPYLRNDEYFHKEENSETIRAFKAGAQFGQALEREKAAWLVEALRLYKHYSPAAEALAKYESGGSGE